MSNPRNLRSRNIPNPVFTNSNISQTSFNNRNPQEVIKKSTNPFPRTTPPLQTVIKKDNFEPLNMGRIRHIKNIQLSFVIICAIFILICICISAVNSYRAGECRVGRSDGKLRPVCYSNMLCNATDSNTDSSVVLGISYPGDIANETLTFPKYQGQGTFDLTVYYNTALPAGGVSFFGNDNLGISLSGVYLQGISVLGGISPDIWEYQATHVMYAAIDNNMGMGTSEGVYVINAIDNPTYSSTNNSLLFTIDGQQHNLYISSDTSNGIFGQGSTGNGTSFNIIYNPGYSDGLVNTREYFFDVARQNYQYYLNERAGLSANNNYSCVDPSYIVPCDGRVYNKDNYKWCKPDGNNCVSFCAPHWNLANNSDGNLNKDSGVYQKNRFSTAASNVFTKPPVYTIGNSDTATPLDNTQLDSAYTQELIFCGGLNSIGDNFSEPSNSNVPNSTVSNKMNLGF